LSTLEDVVEGSETYHAKHQVEHEALHLPLLIIDVLDRHELTRLQTHLPLHHVELGKEALLRPEDHVESFSGMGVDLRPVVEDFTSSYFAYLDLLDLFRHQILAQEVFVDDLTSRLSMVDEVID